MPQETGGPGPRRRLQALLDPHQTSLRWLDQTLHQLIFGAQPRPVQLGLGGNRFSPYSIDDHFPHSLIYGVRYPLRGRYPELDLFVTT